MQRIRCWHHRCPVFWSDLPIHADILMGSHHRYLRRSSRPKVIISCLTTKWSRRPGITTSGKDPNMVFQTGTWLRCENCNQSGHVKGKFQSKGGGQEGQFPWKWDTWTSNTVNSIMDTPIVWAYGSTGRPEVWLSDSATTIHISPNCKDFSSYWKYDEQQDIKAFGNNSVKELVKVT